ncbi:MAG TPA: hypothetical protein PKE32_07240 [Miltoncostaeaceae bacterium]|nr:hypothetical protein [Miltoncostaeaceae bacterium]
MRELTYAQPQIWFLIIFAVMVVLMLAAFVTIGVSSRREVPLKAVKKIGYGIRSWWLVAWSVILLTGLVLGFAFMPYGNASDSGPVSDIAVDSGQFYWIFTPNKVPAGNVSFKVTSRDVNHGMGIYSPDGKLLGSVQAMPGYTNTLNMKLDEPGDYLISCLEFCGVGHHRMHGTITVTGNGEG